MDAISAPIQLDRRSDISLRSSDLSTHLQHRGNFYRVYGNLSVSRYSPDHGFICGSSDVYIIRPEHRLGPDAVKRHLDWTNGEPTNYISIYSSLEAAVKECKCRLSQPRVYEMSRGKAEVACISGLPKLNQEGVFLFATAELIEAKVLTSEDEYVNRNKWLVLDHIPATCVEDVVTARQLIESFPCGFRD